jgi:predicted nucleic acid-binding protein
VRLVVDASVVIPCFVPERFSAAARTWLDAADTLLAPEFLSLECANALWKKVRRKEIALGDARGALEHVVGGFIKLHSSSALAHSALRWGCELDHPAYDCAYIALAEVEQAELLTADRELVRRLLASGSSVHAHWVGHKIPRIH